MDAMKSETRSNTPNEFAVVFDDITSLDESETQEYSSNRTNTSTPELSESTTSSELDSSDDVSLKRKYHYKLQSLSTTRWAARLKATRALISNFGLLHDVLCDINDQRFTTESVRRSTDIINNPNWEFYLILKWWHYILTKMDALSRYMQANDKDLMMIAEQFAGHVV